MTVSIRSLSVGLFSAGILAALLLIPRAASAQFDNTVTGVFAFSDNVKGDWNVAIGMSALAENTTGCSNTATGTWALELNTTGNNNTAYGFEALGTSTTGSYNVANGYEALYRNTTGYCNVANGYETLTHNTTGYYNVANGYEALQSNTTGLYNTANGVNSLYSNTTGSSNEANGVNTLVFNTTGSYNTANGVGALYDNTTGSYNTAEGYFALLNSTTGSYNIALGNGAGLNITTGSNNIAIGNAGTGSDSGIIRIGTIGTHTQTYIAGINGVTASRGVPVYITANGQLGTITSSQRFKYDIQDMGSRSDKLMDLRPVTFRYKEAAEDGTHPQQYGLIAEEVAKVYPDLVQYDKQGKPFTVYYHLLTPMMLNELQKAHQQLASQQTEINSLKAGQQSQVQNPNSALQTQVTSLQQTVHLQFMAFTALVLVFCAYALSSRTRHFPSWRVRPIEKCVS